MIIIRDSRDLMDKYDILKFWMDEQKEYPKEKYPQFESVIIKYKKAIREYLKSQQDYYDNEVRIIKENYSCGYSVHKKLICPNYIDSFEKAKEYFNNNYYREYHRTYYDCTGQIFTSWMEVFKINNRYVVYFMECMDC